MTTHVTRITPVMVFSFNLGKSDQAMTTSLVLLDLIHARLEWESQWPTMSYRKVSLTGFEKKLGRLKVENSISYLYLI